MSDLISELEMLISTVPENVLSLTDVDYKPKPTKWSRKEILGHLCDSASVNYRRFVEMLISTEVIEIVGYQQELWVQANNYQDGYSIEETVDVWTSLNRQILKLLTDLNEEQWSLKCLTKDEGLVTLDWLVDDYLEHTHHHLDQIFADNNIQANL
ncbi:DinB family protein [Alkalihalobacillus sp. AL-G]|uniref:DinB family protein n=1 Tax=Alkalihalobacillus sp. AL-G TaxID=2926399 RepID=UPI00272DA67E|nr:DinB family protein [Alkalihalobacillus sp. AL-G]WLD91673.1 DinB family protein [Alkalihalobacillus sp. AL-G]